MNVWLWAETDAARAGKGHAGKGHDRNTRGWWQDGNETTRGRKKRQNKCMRKTKIMNEHTITVPFNKIKQPQTDTNKRQKIKQKERAQTNDYGTHSSIQTLKRNPNTRHTMKTQSAENRRRQTNAQGRELQQAETKHPNGQEMNGQTVTAAFNQKTSNQQRRKNDRKPNKNYPPNSQMLPALSAAMLCR